MDDRTDHANLRHRHGRRMQYHPLRDAKARGIGLSRLEPGKAFMLLAPLHPAKEVLVRAIEIPQRLRQRLRIHLAQPGRFRLLFQSGQLAREIVIGKRCARLLVVSLLAIQGPIPDKPPCPRKLVEHDFLRNRGVEAIAVGRLDRSCHGGIISDYSFYCKRFDALGSYIPKLQLKPLKRVKPFYPRAEAPGFYGLFL